MRVALIRILLTREEREWRAHAVHGSKRKPVCLRRLRRRHVKGKEEDKVHDHEIQNLIQ